MASVSDRCTWTVTCTGLATIQPQEGKFEINTIPLTAANLVAQQTLLTALQGALINLTLGVVARESISIGTDINAGLPSSVALRGAKWALKAQETTGNKRVLRYEIPAALIAGELIAGTTQADFTTSEWIAFKAAFEAVAVSPYGQALALLAAKYESF